MRKFVAVSSLLGMLLVLFVASSFLQTTQPAVAADEAKAAKQVAVEEDMHEFMAGRAVPVRAEGQS